MATNNLEATRLRVLKVLNTTQDRYLQRGTYIWGKFSKTHWPGIVLTPEDANLDEQKNHYIIFWFGDQTMSSISRSAVELFATNFYKYYKRKNVPLWQKAITEAITHYAYPYTAGMEYNALIEFAFSKQMQTISYLSNIEDLPEFVKLKIYSRKLLRKVQVDNPKKLKQIEVSYEIQSTCVACILTLEENELLIPHPIFHGYLCKECVRKLQEVLYHMDDNIYEYCFICGNTQNFQCKNIACEATYCNFCIKNYWACNVATRMEICILCSSLKVGVLRPRAKYIPTVCIFMLTKYNNVAPVPCKLQQFDITSKGMLKVLTLFDGSSTGIETVFPLPFNVLLVDKCNNQQEYFQPPSVSKAIKKVLRYFNNSFVRFVTLTTSAPLHINAVHMHIEDIHRRRCEEFNDVMLIVGGTSILKHKLQHFRRKSITDLSTHFWRVVSLVKEEVDINTKWIFEMPHTLDYEEITFISRFVNSEPSIVCDSNKKYCYIWSNIITIAV